jgi:hypothetical protein
MLEEAEALLTRAHATLLAQLGPDYEYTRRAHATLRELYTRTQRPAEAARYADGEAR